TAATSPPWSAPSPRTASSPTGWARDDKRAILTREFAPHDGGAVDHGLQLAERHLATVVLHAAVRGDDEPFGIDVGQGRPDPRRHRLRRLHSRVVQVDHPVHDVLAGQLL